MFKDMSKFQLIFTGIFAGFLILGVIIFASYKSGSSKAAEPVTVWGFVDQGQFNSLLEKSGLANDQQTPVTYVQKDPATFDKDLLEAIADGTSPDVVMLDQQQIYKEKARLFPIPYANFDQRTFKDTYIQEAELFLAPEGTLAFPFMIDPYVMYWNRTTFQNAALSQPPKYWDELYNLASTLTKKDGALNITQATVGFGEYKNVTHAKEVLSLLVMQAGSPITKFDGNGRLVSALGDTSGTGLAPAEAAVDFYTEFSDPAKSTYTWNRSLPQTKNMFISGDLALYFGPASELFDIQDKNPNLNFDVASIPQSRDAKSTLTYGDLTGLAIVKSSGHVAAAFKVIETLTSKPVLSYFGAITNLPPVRRDMLSAKPTNAYGTVFYNSAIISQGWIDPSSDDTDAIFQELIESITSGRARPSDAVGLAGTELSGLIHN